MDSAKRENAAWAVATSPSSHAVRAAFHCCLTAGRSVAEYAFNRCEELPQPERINAVLVVVRIYKATGSISAITEAQCCHEIGAHRLIDPPSMGILTGVPGRCKGG